MQPIFGFMLYFACSVIVASIAKKKGRSFLAFFFGSLIFGFALVRIISAAGGSSLAAGFGAFLSPLTLLLVAALGRDAQEKAAEHGQYGDYKRCPFCAEAVRRAAIKCKHCGSELPT